MRFHFEYDPEKDKANLERHGIDFIKAQELWRRTHVVAAAKNVAGENRNAILGKLEGNLYIAIFTQRGGAIRLITCHRADSRWERYYERCIQEEEKS